MAHWVVGMSNSGDLKRDQQARKPERRDRSTSPALAQFISVLGSLGCGGPRRVTHNNLLHPRSHIPGPIQLVLVPYRLCNQALPSSTRPRCRKQDDGRRECPTPKIFYSHNPHVTRLYRYMYEWFARTEYRYLFGCNGLESGKRIFASSLDSALS